MATLYIPKCTCILMILPVFDNNNYFDNTCIFVDKLLLCLYRKRYIKEHFDSTGSKQEGRPVNS